MHTLYKQKKTLLLVALFSINNLGSFVPAIKALPTENISNRYALPPLSTLPPRVAMIAKNKEHKYTKILKYYEYRAHWSEFVILALLSILTISSIIYFIKTIAPPPSSFRALRNIDKKFLFSCIVFSTIFAVFLYLSISSFLEKSHPGAIFLTDTGILFIQNSYNAKYKFIPYTDIKTVAPTTSAYGSIERQTITEFQIQFIKNFIDYERKGIKYIDVVNSITIAERNIPNKASGGNAFKNLYRSLLNITEKLHMEAMREKGKQESAQEKGKSLLQIKKEQEGFIDGLEYPTEELYTKTATVQTNHPAIFTQIEAYYSNGIGPRLLIRYVLIGSTVIGALMVILYDRIHHAPFLAKHVIDTIKQLLTILSIIGSYTYNQYNLFMHPAGLLITDTGFLYIKAGKKLKYTFIRYEHIEELLRNVNKQTLLVRSTQSTHEATSWMNGTMSQTLKVECDGMKKELFDALYKKLRLKKAEVKAGKSRLAK